MLLQMALFHSSLWLSNILLYVCTTSLSIHVSGHLACLCVLTIVNSSCTIPVLSTQKQSLLTVSGLGSPYIHHYNFQ